jgi:hypothetical protein
MAKDVKDFGFLVVHGSFGCYHTLKIAQNALSPSPVCVCLCGKGKWLILGREFHACQESCSSLLLVWMRIEMLVIFGGGQLEFPCHHLEAKHIVEEASEKLKRRCGKGTTPLGKPSTLF